MGSIKNKYSFSFNIIVVILIQVLLLYSSTWAFESFLAGNTDTPYPKLQINSDSLQSIIPSYFKHSVSSCLAPVTNIDLPFFRDNFEKGTIRQTVFVAKDQTEERIGALLNQIIEEHNRDILPEDKAKRFVPSGFEISEAREKFIQEGGKLWARVVMSYEDGHKQEYIFKQEYAYAMDEIGYYLLKILGIGASETRRYGTDLFLIKPIGQFNMSKIKDQQYHDPIFREKLSYLSGRAAARAFIMGLADRKAENMRVILDKQGLPKEIINADLASVFTHIKKVNLKSGLSDGSGILADIFYAAKKADVSNNDLALIINLFLKGFDEQMLDFETSFPEIKDKFAGIDPNKYDRLDRMWVVMDNLKTRSKGVLDRIDPIIANHEYTQLMHMAIMLKRISTLLSRESNDDFILELFEPKGVLYPRIRGLLVLLNEKNETVLKENLLVFQEALEAFNSMAFNLAKIDNYKFSAICDHYGIKTGNILLMIDPKNQFLYQNQLNRADVRLRKSIEQINGSDLNPDEFTRPLLEKILADNLSSRAI